MIAQLGLNLVRRLLDHVANQIRFAAIRGLKFEPHRFRRGFEQCQQILARNFRA